MSQHMIVTGGSQGIGAACVRLAAARGYAVGFSFRQAEAEAGRLVAEVEAAGGRAAAFQADVADERQIVRFFDDAERKFGPPQAVVNNAGITGGVSKITDVTTAILDEVMDTNVRGAFLVLREAARRMAEGGAIVNVSSRASEIGGAHEFIHYAASKGAVDTLTIGASRELGPRGIRVNAVNPGLITTEIHAKAGMPDRAQRMGTQVPMGRPGSAEEVAKVILWLLSDEASYVTGALVPISGGR